MGKHTRNRVVAVLGASGVLAGVLSGAVLTGAGSPAWAQPAAARGFTPPKACVAIEALVGDGVSGPAPGGEVLRVQPGGQGTLTTNTAPAGAPDLDLPDRMAFMANRDIVVSDEGITTGVPLVAGVNPVTGARTLLSGSGRGTGPALRMPTSVAVEAGGDILVTDIDPSGLPWILRINPATGDRTVLSGSGSAVGTGSLMVTWAVVSVQGGVIYAASATGELLSVDPVTGNRTLVSGAPRGTGPTFVAPVSMVSDAAGSLVVLDRDHVAAPGKGLGGLIRVDLTNGNRTVLSDDANPSKGQQFDSPSDVQYNACDNSFYVLQTGFGLAGPAGRVLKVDASSGARTLFASYQGAENYALLLRPIPVTSPIGGGAGGGGGGGD
jgi:hypothetical protein